MNYYSESHFGSVEGIDIHKDRRSIYKTVYITPVKTSKPIVESATKSLPFGVIVWWCAENIETWEVTEAIGQKAIGEAVGLHKNIPKQSYDTKLVKHGYFFYPKGLRPSEDEIDAMLDKWEAKQEWARVRREQNGHR